MQFIKDLVTKALVDLALPSVDFSLDHPRDESHGDYSVNVAMVLGKREGKNPREVAEKMVEQLTANGQQLTAIVEKVEVAGAGFINFYLTNEFCLKEVKQAIKPGYGENNRLKGQKIMVEFTDPNPFKEFHIGHLMSNTVGESIARLFEASGAVVKRANYQGDVGLHVAKSVWGMLALITNNQTPITKQFENNQLTQLRVDWSKKSLQERQQFMGKAYAYGATKYEGDPTAKAEMHAMNAEIYKRTNVHINELYDLGRKWSLEYFELIYSRLGTKFDGYFFESEAGKVGLQVVEEGLTKGVLELGEEGAVVFKGEKYGLHTRVFRNKLGLPTYEGKELGLAKTKYSKWKYDKSYIITANEIDEYFKVLIKVLTLLYPELGNKTTHLSHGVMKLTSGKMSSRTGNVVTGEGLLDQLKEVVELKMGEREIADKDRVADAVAVGALKYSVLRQAIGGDIVYAPAKMTNLEGNTGPFVQYTYARAMSILRKVGEQTKNRPLLDEQVLQRTVLFNEQELSILKWVYRYPEVVAEAGEQFAPHLVATYIYELAQRFNTFYQACRVEENGAVNKLRYLLTEACANILASGLGLLGIRAPEEM